MTPAPPDRSGSTAPARRGFRDDIQGMRALAVLGILVFHAGLAPYSGGFVTLDVFFVLSGFLITTLLLREVAATGTIDLIAFYVRRARRILPAATVAIVGTVTASYLWLHPLDARDAAVDGVWASLFGANVRFAVEETDYFTRSDPPSPLQHFWSLSVEEQFYLVMPVALLGAVLVAARLLRRGDRGRTVAMVGVLSVASAASLAWSVHASTASPESAYFSTFTRVWEFGAGSLLAIAAPRLAGSLTPLVRNLVVAAGLGLVALAMFTLTTESAFPGWLALLPVVGTCLVILGGTGAGTEGDRLPLAQRALGVRPLRVVGDASYSLYLWHWPVLVIAEQRLARELTPLDLCVVLAVTVLMTWASYRFVETPFRRVRGTRSRGMLLYPAAVTTAVVVCLASTHLIDRQVTGDDPGIEVADYERGIDGSALSDDPAIAAVQASVRAALEGREVPRDLRPALTELKDDRADLGACEYVGTPERLCLRGDPDGDRTLVVLGNSHGRHWAPALDRIAERAGWKAYFLVKSQCTPARVQMVRGGQDEPWRGCLDFNDWAEDRVRELAPDLTIVSTSGAPNVEVDGEVVRETDGVVAELGHGMARLLDDLGPLTDRLVLLEDVPRRRTSPERCLPLLDSDLGDCLSGTTRRADAVSRVSTEAAEAAGVEVVRTRQWFCDRGRCPAVIKDMVPQRDVGHVTTTYARWLATPLGRALGLLPPRDGDQSTRPAP
ncbi:Peptidoglycan/LPS O-acetylase OafA/YrhL, contains acyltransferase and SGNH-hydrolase domains [Nocardioides exalbidus]|uniref:Peptidoglycan/LPS O-acetylase OafA/YrhL, contains acyltransferase and SGNH-hydrolase domains n=1 Tax=Nocardioides exalbidus TaxID=402596 RepID=A0A1H4PAB7_9ACTN|nr:acyltransferase family protein [Nocardioides exalbidus]SEC04357.1 Peptidoglycan/LPS O-acetylase OafA/YrhL, contains acyltransferase and SGNH-hydrolase domains [Nocardioides exalbidus]